MLRMCICAIIIIFFLGSCLLLDNISLNVPSELEFLKLVSNLYSTSPDNTRYFLSALSQVQASILGIFFTLNFIIAQIQIQNKAVSPYSMRNLLNSNMLKLIILIFIISITLDLLLIGYVGVSNINIFVPSFLAIFAILQLFSYTGSNLMDLFHETIYAEIINGEGRANLRGANLNWASLKRVDLRYKTLENASLMGTDLEEASLQGANLTRCNLNEAILKKSKLQGATLVEANLERAKLETANLEGAKLEKANLKEAFFEGANLVRANLDGANLEKAILRKANLMGSNLSRVNLANAYLNMANLRGTTLIGADFSGADLEGTDLTEVNIVNEEWLITHIFGYADFKKLDGSLESQQNILNILNLLKAKNLDKAIIDDKLKDTLKIISSRNDLRAKHMDYLDKILKN